jgi:hypothetical protein
MKQPHWLFKRCGCGAIFKDRIGPCDQCLAKKRDELNLARTAQITAFAQAGVPIKTGVPAPREEGLFKMAVAAYTPAIYAGDAYRWWCATPSEYSTVLGKDFQKAISNGLDSTGSYALFRLAASRLYHAYSTHFKRVSRDPVTTADRIADLLREGYYKRDCWVEQGFNADAVAKTVFVKYTANQTQHTVLTLPLTRTNIREQHLQEIAGVLCVKYLTRSYAIDEHAEIKRAVAELLRTHFAETNNRNAAAMAGTIYDWWCAVHARYPNVLKVAEQELEAHPNWDASQIPGVFNRGAGTVVSRYSALRGNLEHTNLITVKLARILATAWQQGVRWSDPDRVESHLAKLRAYIRDTREGRAWWLNTKRGLWSDSTNGRVRQHYINNLTALFQAYGLPPEIWNTVSDKFSSELTVKWTKRHAREVDPEF